MSEKHLYDVQLSWTSDRKGTLSSETLPQKIEVATPPEFPKGMPGIWSPEHLFVASVSSCLMTTFLAIAEFSKLDYLRFNVDAIGTLEKVDGKFKMSVIELRPVVEIDDASKEAKALRIIEKAEAACLISNSITSEIVLKPTVKIVEAEVA
ncbi:MAG: OsmC family protein [Balneolaceae bacterium]|jgi:peroxiredoxin-like protein|nr:OsmC family protein [Balneolaceae bacterium]MCR9131921.1 OsmC family protein [bacterium]